MKKILVVAGVYALLAAPVSAQNQNSEEAAPPPPSAEEVDAAAKTITDLAADKERVAKYCAIVKEMDTLQEGQDQKAEELGKRMDEYISGEGEEIQNAFAVAELVDPESDQGPKLDEAFGKLDEACGF